MQGTAIFAAPGVSFQKIEHFSATQLKELGERQILPGVNWFKAFDNNANGLGPLDFTPPSRGVTLYRMTYEIDTNKKNYGRQTVSGLIAIPDGDESGSPRKLPLAMYNHGTVFNRNEVPSNVLYSETDENGNKIWQIGSGETFFQLCRIVDAGYALIAPDYIGLGINKELNPDSVEGYSAKEITNQATFGILEASRAILSHLNVKPTQLFLNGWSQGSLNTQWLTQKLETLGIPVAATVLQAPMNDWLGLSRWASTLQLQQSEPNSFELNTPAPWLPLAMARAIGSYETWYDLSGLLDAIVKDTIIPDRQFNEEGVLVKNPPIPTYENNPNRLTYRQVIKNFLEDYSYISFEPGKFSNNFWTIRLEDGKTTTIPGFTSEEMLIDGLYTKPQSDVISDYLRQLQFNTPRYWKYTTPVRAWYGLKDEALPKELVDPDLAIFGGSKVSLVPVKDGSHRQAYINSLYASPENPGGTEENLLSWFASFLSPDQTPPELVATGDKLILKGDHFGILPVLFEVEKQQGNRALHVQILRVLNDGTSEVVGSLGGTTSSAGQLQTLGGDRVLLQVGERLEFQLMSLDGSRIESSTTQISPGPEGKYSIIIHDALNSAASLQVQVQTDEAAFAPGIMDQMAALQDSATAGLLQLNAGQVVGLEVSTDSAFVNQLGFIKLNLDPVTGLPNHTVGAENIAVNSEEFRTSIGSLLDGGFLHKQGGRKVQSDLQWLVEDTGVYAPVLITPEGNVFTYGFGPDADMGHLRVTGQNILSFEDLNPLQADWDFNDLVVRVISST